MDFFRSKIIQLFTFLKKMIALLYLNILTNSSPSNPLSRKSVCSGNLIKYHILISNRSNKTLRRLCQTRITLALAKIFKFCRRHHQERVLPLLVIAKGHRLQMAEVKSLHFYTNNDQISMTKLITSSLIINKLLRHRFLP